VKDRSVPVRDIQVNAGPYPLLWVKLKIDCRLKAAMVIHRARTNETFSELVSRAVATELGVTHNKLRTIKDARP
jgi:hypothetical protein